MKTNSLTRHQLIEKLVAQHAVEGADAAILLWEQITIAIASIIGEEGFKSLYARTVFVSRQRFPSLVPSDASLQTNQLFADLKKSFEGQSSAEIITMNNFLLCAFTDTLASLIGEELTFTILVSAWVDHVSEKKSRDKETDNEW